MRPELERLQRIERHSRGEAPPEEGPEWNVQLLLDPDLRADAEAAAELCAHRRLACPHHADQHDAAFHRSRSLGVIHRAE